MALCTTSAPFNLLSGAFADRSSASGVVANPTGGRNILREYVIPDNPGTILQNITRGYFTNCATAFSSLTQAQIAPWNDLAAAIERTGRLGLPYNPTGQNMFVSVNWLRLLDGQAIDNTPPALELLPALDPESVTFEFTAGSPDTAAINWTDSLPAGSFVQVRATTPLATTAQNGRINLAKLVGAPLSNSIPLSSAETAAVSITRIAPAVGTFHGVLLQSVSSGYLPGQQIFISRQEVTEPE